MKSGGKTSYEIRSDLLRLSYDILHDRMEQQNGRAESTEDMGAAPDTDEVIAEAVKLNKFVSDDRR